jgi:membrane-associated phospholipid phosphatase
MKVDGAIGGLALLRSMASIETPWLTSFFKLTWIGYYPLAILVGVPLHRKGREHLMPAKNALILGWVASFLCYFALPAKGPGWHPEATGVPQPKFEASVVSSAAKAMIAAAESPEPRHTFPSGHTIIAVITMWYLIRHRAGAWMWCGVPLSMAIVLSTVYLRYHYVVDVIVGVAVAVACIVVGSRPSPLSNRPLTAS